MGKASQETRASYSLFQGTTLVVFLYLSQIAVFFPYLGRIDQKLDSLRKLYPLTVNLHPSHKMRN